jgi:hypothetical protein
MSRRRRRTTDGPAVVDANGDIGWYLDGKLHRVDGPAALHRQYTPAVAHPNGLSDLWLEGTYVSDEMVEWLEESGYPPLGAKDDPKRVFCASLGRPHLPSTPGRLDHDRRR